MRQTVTASVSAAQREAWLGHHFGKTPQGSTIPIVLCLRGQLDQEALRRALNHLVARHDGFRSRYRAAGGALCRDIEAPAPVEMVIEDLGGLPPAERGPAVAAVTDRAARSTFDPASGGLLRARLVRVSPHEHVLCLTSHRVCLDEATTDVLVAELLADLAGKPPADLSRGGRAVDDGYAASGSDARTGAVPLDVPTDRARPDRSSGTIGYACRAFTLGPPPVPGSGSPDDFGVQTAVATAALLVLCRHGGQGDILIGLRTPPAERVIAPATASTLRFTVDDDLRFGAAVTRVGDAVADTAHRPCPPRDEPRARTRVTLRLAGPVPPVVDVGGLVIERWDTHAGLVDDDLEVRVRVRDGAAEVSAVYDADLFDAARVERLLGHVEITARAGLSRPEATIASLPMLSLSEWTDIMTSWQGPEVAYPREPIHQQIAAHARRDPGHEALRYGPRVLTYAEVERRVDLVARRLRSHGVGREDIVAILLERGIDAVIAMIGVLRAGAAFTVLDPEHPAGRWEFILADTGARVIVTNDGLLPRLPEPRGWVPVRMDGDWPAIDAQSTEEPLTELADEHTLAYVLYTSGSTGQPKGALIDHGSLSNFVLWPRWQFDLGPGDRMLQHMTLTFDFSEGEIFSALASGATLVIAPEKVRASPRALGDLIATERITCVFGPPAVLSTMELGPCPDLRVVVVGGDICTGDLVTRWNTPGRRFVNGYGPTEATVGCTGYECEHRVWTSQPPIGRAMPNRLTYILDPAGRPCPVGVAGELYVGGAGVARGYLHREDLTRERFVVDPWRPGGRMYRTGDLCEWTADGQIRFLGRIDTQVKVNGLRVELEEIEAALATHPSVRQAAVSPVDLPGGPRRLVAHLVLDSADLDVADLRAHLATMIPGNLIPARYHPIAALPLTPVGKLDRAALRASIERDTAPAQFRPPRTLVERQVAGLVGQALGRTTIGVDDDLLGLGATTLDLVDIAERLNGLTGAHLRPRDVLTARTVAALVDIIARAQRRLAAADPLALLARIEQMSDEEIERVSRR